MYTVWGVNCTKLYFCLESSTCNRESITVMRHEKLDYACYIILSTCSVPIAMCGK